jgi:hypothetical protein
MEAVAQKIRMTKPSKSTAKPAEWSVDIMRSKQALAYVYFEPDPDNESRRAVMNRLTYDEVRRIAVNIGRLPALLGADKYR